MIGPYKLQLHMSVLDQRLGFPNHALFQESRLYGRVMIGQDKLQLHMSQRLGFPDRSPFQESPLCGWVTIN